MVRRQSCSLQLGHWSAALWGSWQDLEGDGAAPALGNYSQAGAATGTPQDLTGVSNSLVGTSADQKLSLKIDFYVKLSFQQISIFVSTARVLQAALIYLFLKRKTKMFLFSAKNMPKI